MNEIKNENAYDELSIIINHQEILQQKVSVLMAINTGILLLLVNIGLTVGIVWWGYLLIIGYSLIPIFINIKILLPFFNSKSKSKYFFDYADMSLDEIKKYLLENDNVFSQIKINSQILKNKYKLFKWSLSITFFFIPLLFYIKK